MKEIKEGEDNEKWGITAVIGATAR